MFGILDVVCVMRIFEILGISRSILYCLKVIVVEVFELWFVNCGCVSLFYVNGDIVFLMVVGRDFVCLVRVLVSILSWEV